MMIPVTIAASCAFMLPVATPPNAIVFATGRVTIREMMRYGIVLNFIGVALAALVCYLLLPVVFGVDYGAGVPGWARPSR
jgi:sodium-dependent dicarboxylate transporter 2/3/5